MKHRRTRRADRQEDKRKQDAQDLRAEVLSRLGPAGRDIVILDEPDPRGKLSEAIAALAEEYLDDDPDEELHSAMLNMASLAWNLAAAEGTSIAREMEMLVRNLNDDRALALLHSMAKRKQELFPNDHRLVIDSHVVNVGDELRLRVVSVEGPA